jgi:hypothetical protein
MIRTHLQVQKKFFKAGYAPDLVTYCVPLLDTDRVKEKLEEGADVAE